MANNNENGTFTTEREIITKRLLNAPRELVFETFTQPEHLAKWYGPNGFTITTHEMEVKPGGTWRFIMHGPDGIDYPNKIIYEEVVQPERLVYAQAGEGEYNMIQFHVIITFEAISGQTKLTMCSKFNTPEDLQRVAVKLGAVEGAIQTVNRLAEHLEQIQTLN